VLDNKPAKDRASAIRILRGHLQHLNRQADFVPLHVVAGMGEALLRLCIADGGWPRELWEALADEDPYFHVTLAGGKEEKITRPWPGGVYSDGKYYAPGSFSTYELVKGKGEKRALAPILAQTPRHKAALKTLIELSQSQAPILRADWFFNQTAAAVDRKTNFYSFTGLKTQDDFERLIGFDRKLAEPFIELRDAIAKSNITLRPRAIARFSALGGGYWATFDFKVPKDKKNPLRIIGRDIELQHDASELYGLNPCGFWVAIAADGKRKVQDAVPDAVASDHHRQGNDSRIHPNVSCVRCHRQGGLQSLDGAWYRNLVSKGNTFNFPNFEDSIQFRQQYVSRRLEPFLARDRAIYAASVLQVTGLTTEQYADAYAAFWSEYEDAHVDAAWAARDLGVSVEVLKGAVARQKLLLKSDPVLAALAGGDSVDIREWEASVQLAYTAVFEAQLK
jgi:hypothetical protein